MKNITYILLLFSLSVFGQRPNNFNDSTYFARSVRFQVPPYIIQGAGNGKVLTSDANGRATWQTFSSAGVTQGALDDSISAVRAIRKVDTIYKSLDSIVFKINGIRYAVLDSTGGGVQTLSISGDTLSISGGNSVVLPVYVQADSSTISSYEVLNSQNAPPGSPSTGDVYLVGTSPTGAWVGHAKDIAEWNGSAWVFTDGVQGDFLYNATTALTYIFRSGNWVQTTGIPALHNGNNISSGLKIGTNNARSLTFETNNANRGRFDSIGRFHVYNLPTASTADTFVTKSDLGGKLTKVGQSTFLSGVNSAFIPLSGTVSGSPVTGDIEMKESTYLKLFQNSSVGNKSIDFADEFSITIGLYDTVNVTENKMYISTDGFKIINTIPDAKGLQGEYDYSPNITDLDYPQKIYVDQRISDTATQIRSEIADTASSLYTLINAKVSASGTATLTNKRITARVDSTASSATPTINTDNVDTYKLTAQAVDITSFTTNLTGTPTDDQILHIVIIGTATRVITWGSKFESSTVALPTTTVGTNRLDVYFIFNTATSKWRCGGVW